MNDFSEDENKPNKVLIYGLIILFIIMISFFVVFRFIVFSPSPMEYEEKYYMYDGSIEYNTTFESEDLLTALEPLNYHLIISNPYIFINCSLSLSKFNETAEELNGVRLSNGSLYSDEIEFLLWIGSYYENNHLVIEFDTNNFDATPFTDKKHSQILMEKFAIYIEELIYQQTSEEGNIEVLQTYTGPVA